jgi:hypothetical protein
MHLEAVKGGRMNFFVGFPKTNPSTNPDQNHAHLESVEALKVTIISGNAARGSA